MTEQAENRASVTRDESRASYVVILHNVRTYESGGVVEVVSGRQNAETVLKKLEDWQPSEAHTEGWRYFFEKSGLRAGMDPAQATHLRQENLEIRESTILRGMKTH